MNLSVNSEETRLLKILRSGTDLETKKHILTGNPFLINKMKNPPKKLTDFVDSLDETYYYGIDLNRFYEYDRPSQNCINYALRMNGYNIKYVKNPTRQQKYISLINILTVVEIFKKICQHFYTFEYISYFKGKMYYLNVYFHDMDGLLSNKEKYNICSLNNERIGMFTDQSRCGLTDWNKIGIYTGPGIKNIFDEGPICDLTIFKSDYDCIIDYK